MYAFSRFLHYFVEVARSGSIRKAADILNVAPSAISRQILQVERDIQQPLFERLPSGLRPTAAGELLLARCRRWRTDFAQVSSEIGDLAELRRGHVAIAIMDALAEGLVPIVLRRLQTRYPDITVTVRVMENNEVHDAIGASEVDFGFMLRPPISQAIAVQAEWEIFIGFVTLPTHPLAASLPARFARGLEFPMIMPSAPLSLYERIRLLEVATGITLKAAVSTDSIQMIKSLVSSGAGVGILTSLDVMGEVEAGALRFTPILDLNREPMPLSLCVSRSRQLSHAARCFLTHFEEAMLRWHADAGDE